MKSKGEYLAVPVEHISLKRPGVAEWVEAMARTAFSARELGRAAQIFDRMLRDPDCSVILSLAGSLVSAGLRQVIHDLVAHQMVDAIVSTGANIVDQDFFEALGFRHYQGSPHLDDDELRRLRISRIYDTLIDEDQLAEVDAFITRMAAEMEPRPYSSREFVVALGRELSRRGLGDGSIVRAAAERGVPIFVPAFSDCAAGFGLLNHQWERPGAHVSIDAVRDFLELAIVKRHAAETGLFMVGGGVPKNFAQDVALATERMGRAPVMHRYAVQITVADVRDGALSSSTLREACSWGKVALENEQMVFAEATLALPLIAGYAWERGAWKSRAARRFNDVIEAEERKRSA
jgi:deoxyhypusine synthase